MFLKRESLVGMSLAFVLIFLETECEKKGMRDEFPNLIPRSERERSVLRWMKLLTFQTRRNRLLPVAYWKRFQKKIDLPGIIERILGNHYKNFTPEELKSFSEAFIEVVFQTALIRFESLKQPGINYRFIDYPWRWESSIVAISVGREGDDPSVVMILEFDKKTNRVVDFHFDGQSSAALYSSEFDRLIRKKGKEEFLRLVKKKAGEGGK